MFDVITSWLSAMGSFGVAAPMLLENVFPPIPSEVIMHFAGYLAASGDLAFVAVVIAGTIGSVAGACLWYWIGSLATEPRMRRFVVQHGKWLTISENDLDRSLVWFRGHGGAAVFLGRIRGCSTKQRPDRTGVCLNCGHIGSYRLRVALKMQTRCFGKT